MKVIALAATTLALLGTSCGSSNLALPGVTDAGAGDGANGGAGGLAATGGTSGAAGSSLGGSGGAGAGGQGGTASDAAVTTDAAATTGACLPGECPGGVCWQRLDGGKECLDPHATVPREMCPSFDQTCCMADTDCTQHAGGHCVSRLASTLGCGGARPFGNGCLYDACTTDADCAAGKPAGATVAACIPTGALGLHTATCIYGGCRTDADCTLHPGGSCQFGLAATHDGACDLRQVLYCGYPTDPCQARYGSCPTDAGPGPVCVPEESYQGRRCVPPPPAYP
jgi:hypothetical protein